MSVRVVVVDDHPVVRDGLAGMLAGAGDLVLIGEAADGAGAVALVERCRPDVVLMDLQMPVLDGVAATRQILEAHPEVRVLVLTTFADDRDIVAAVEAGAAGYLLKDAPRAELFEAVRAAAAGRATFTPVVAAALARRVRAPQPEHLSERELQVVRLVAEGRTNAAIGRALAISEATVKTHLLHAFAKLGVTDRTAAVMAALDRGLLDGQPGSPSPRRRR